MSIKKILIKESSISQQDIDNLLNYADGFRSEDEAREYIRELLTSFFPYGINMESDQVYLYRILFLHDTENYIDENNLCKHWVGDPEVISDEEWVDFIAMANDFRADVDKVVLIALYNSSDIDILTTLTQNVLNPHEKEFTLDKPDRKPKELFICSYENFNYREPLSSKNLKKII